MWLVKNVLDRCDPTILSVDLLKAIDEDKLYELFSKKENIRNCLKQSVKIEKNIRFIENDSNTEFAVTSCVNKLLNSQKQKKVFNTTNARFYCECAVKTLIDSGYTLSELQRQASDQNSVLVNEIALPCLNEALYFNKAGLMPNSDIVGSIPLCEVQLLRYFDRGYKLKLSIDGIVKYFIFDTGASDLIIDEKMEKELLANGSIRKEDYLGDVYYTLANGQDVKGRKIKVNNVKIGDYIVNNTEIGIVENGHLLCGSSFLEKFQNWHFDKESLILTLYK